MTISSVSTPYLGTAMLPAINQAEAQVSQLEIETSTGQYADLGLQLGGQTGYELSLRNSDDLLQALTNSNSIVAGGISTASNALSAINASAQSALSALVAWTPGAGVTTNLAATGDDAIQGLVGLANTTYSNQYVFGGINSATPPMAGFSASSPSQAALLNAFQTQFGCAPTDPAASAISASAMQSFLSGAFDDQFTGADWATNWSSASSDDTVTEIAPGQTAQTSTNLNSGGFQDLSQAYSMLALFGGTELSGAAQQAVVTTATSLIGNGMSATIAAAAQLGQTQGQIKQADDDMGTQLTLLKTQIGNLDNVSGDQVVTQLNTLTTQIETAYQITAQLQKLSLAQYLPA